MHSRKVYSSPTYRRQDPAADWNEVWRTATADVPDLLNKLEMLLGQDSQQNE